MKPILLGIALLFGLYAFAGQEKPRPVDWQPIFEIKGNTKAYYDANGSVDVTDTLRSGVFMVVYESSQKFNIGGKEFYARSLVRSFAIDCEKRISAPLSDMYFLEISPNLKSIPVAAFEYKPGAGLQEAEENSILYRYLCGPRV